MVERVVGAGSGGCGIEYGYTPRDSGYFGVDGERIVSGQSATRGTAKVAQERRGLTTSCTSPL